MGVSYLTTAAADEWKQQTVLLQLPDILQIFLSKVCYSTCARNVALPVGLQLHQQQM